ncbi:MAG: S8 family serine peptidase [Thermoproteota archaeon]
MIGKLVGAVSKWVEAGLIPNIVSRIIVETDRIEDLASEISQRIKQPIISASLKDTVLRLAHNIVEGRMLIQNMMSMKKIPRFKLLSFPATVKLIEELEADKRVRKIYPDRFIKTVGYPTIPYNEAYRDKKTGELFVSTFQTRKILGAEKANQEGYTGRMVSVAVIDTTALPTHSAISHAIPQTAIPGLYSDLNGHGVWCLACIGGKYYINTVYNVPTIGMAPDATLIAVKALGYVLGFGHESDILEAMQISERLGANIVSMSLGSEELEEEDPQVKAIETLTREKNMIFVVASGNSGPNSGTVNSPGVCEEAITVGAYDPISGWLASFSSRGPTPDGRVKPDIVMPGVNVFAPTIGLLDYVETPKGALRVSALSGTSMATPHAAGLVALMYEHASRHNIKLTAEMIKDVMLKYGDHPKNNDTGWGVLTWDKWKLYAKEVLGI